MAGWGNRTVGWAQREGYSGREIKCQSEGVYLCLCAHVHMCLWERQPKHKVRPTQMDSRTHRQTHRETSRAQFKSFKDHSAEKHVRLPNTQFKVNTRLDYTLVIFFVTTISTLSKTQISYYISPSLLFRILALLVAKHVPSLPVAGSQATYLKTKTRFYRKYSILHVLA